MTYLMKGRLQTLVMGLSVLLLLGACGIFGSDGDQGNVEVKMHDFPVLYQEVNVEIERVEAKSSGEGEGWVTLSNEPTRVDVTTLINGNFATLANADLEAGSYSQLRLIFGANNTMKMSGENYDLELSSEAEEGVVLNINLNVDAESQATLLLDFNLRKSIIRGALDLEGTVLMNPVIEVRRAEQTGSVSGTIKPVRANPWVHALNNSDTVSSTLADTSSGEFQLSGLEEDSYDIYIEPTDSLYRDSTLTNIEVEARENNNVGEIELSVRDSTKSEPLR